MYKRLRRGMTLDEALRRPKQVQVHDPDCNIAALAREAGVPYATMYERLRRRGSSAMTAAPTRPMTIDPATDPTADR